MKEMKKCFVVSPIGEEGTEIRKRTDKLFKHIISPVCEKCELEAIRVDKINDTDTITNTIIEHLKNDELVIADITDHNPNAFYEIGFRSSTGKPMIQLRQKGEKIPFDISTIRTFEYDLTDLDKVEEIKERLEQTILAFDFSKESKFEYTNKNDLETEKREMPQILNILYDIQDKISDLTKEIKNKDTQTIETAIQAVAKVNALNIPEDPNISLMKAIMPEVLRNPEAFKEIIKLSEQTKYNNYKNK